MQEQALKALSRPSNLPNEEDSWILEATDQTNYVGSPVANGQIGILPWCQPFSIKHVIINHVFEFSENKDVYRVIKAINPFDLKLKINGTLIDNNNISNWKQIIHMKTATHTTSFTFQDKAKIEYSIVALRGLPYAGLVTTKVESINNSKLTVEIENCHSIPQGEYINSKSLFEFREFPENAQLLSPKQISINGKINILRSSSTTTYGSHSVSASSAFRLIESSSPATLSYDQGQCSQVLKTEINGNSKLSFALIGAICTTRDYKDVRNESERQILFATVETVEHLLEKHEELWSKLWESDVKIEGEGQNNSCLGIQRIVRFALFNLYSFCREGSRLSISPMGLSSQGYNGHIFWDTELWMYPPLLVLNQGIARSLVDYRIDRQKAASQNAYSHGYKGLMYPWESDDNGEECTPTWALTGPLEHHVTADIGFALWNYYLVTKDQIWLKNEGYPAMKGVADFWTSRVVKVDNYYSIERVVGADEYAENITDNAFTNGAAIKCLEFAAKAAEIVGENDKEMISKWKEIAANLKIWKFDDGTTKEYKDYNGQMIKQADVNLLGYPLNVVSNEEDQKKDLIYYEEKVDPNDGPLMCYSVFVVQWARHLNIEKVTELLPRCYMPNLRPPFGALSETPNSQNPYFATGAGALLQAVIFGFAGLEITENGIIQKPSVLPKGWKKLTITGVGPEKKTFTRLAQ
ncbi:hypothetical protein M9Y10_024499 [Tritrichomonas musculus]|uniref:Glycoside hydrolase family 65 central catalytic domain-containing protein n=1 Tax=Tritrichomonas musculus TaxID=1915356 RepID=A0ABR2HC44_9EUKA